MRLPGAPKVVRLARAASTQEEARRLADSGAPSGTLLWAREQSAGRGRAGRRWRSPPGGLYATWLLRPSFPPERLGELSLALGSAAARALAGFGAITAVKPPNDVLARGADGRWRKLCGILCEASGDSRGLHWLLVGFGVNVNNAPPLRRAASLRGLTGRRVPVPRVLAALLRGFERARREGDFV